MAQRLALVIPLAFLLWPDSVAAQDDSDTDEDDVLIRINGPFSVTQSEALDAVIGISDKVVVDGTVDSELVVISGTLTLGSTAQIRNVTLVRSD